MSYAERQHTQLSAHFDKLVNAIKRGEQVKYAKCKITLRTDKAFLVEQDGRQVWLPKAHVWAYSVVEMATNTGYAIVALLPWLAGQKELNYIDYETFTAMRNDRITYDVTWY